MSQYLLQPESGSTTTHQRRKLLSLFPTHHPRHIVDGLVTFVRSALVGSGLGLVTLISVPVAEFLKPIQQEAPLDNHGDEDTHHRTLTKTTNRWLRLMVGGINGALLGSTFVVVGFVNGFYQAVRGVIQTPIAIQAMRKGMIWDMKHEVWKFYYLTDDLEELESFQPFQDESRSVKDRTFYDMLNVSTNANAKDIKRAYHKKARAVHPDKNLGTESAADEFRKLHVAYLTLSDTDQRIAYDRWGRSSDPGGGADDAPGIADFDPNVFFTILFNAKPVESYIGASTLASLTKQSMHFVRSGNGNSIEDVLRLLWSDNQSLTHRRRHLSIAMHLSEKVSPYINGTVSKLEFQKQCRDQAMEIAREPFGVTYLSMIGAALTLESDRYTITNTKVLGKLSSHFMSIASKLATIRRSGNVLQEIVSAAKLVKENEITNIDEAELLQLLLPTIFQIGWMFHEIDVKHAIHQACLKLFVDASLSDPKQRLERAVAIRLLAAEFLLVAQDETERSNYISDTLLSADEWYARIQVAAEISVMKVGFASTRWRFVTIQERHLILYFFIFVSRLVHTRHLDLIYQMTPKLGFKKANKNSNG